ncbi:MAG: hypothetical protein M1820_002789 [Bogoriella megaspora]|nr:MAG: hypothetical protein M1820_002789 [Bogoriella megaspora]
MDIANLGTETQNYNSNSNEPIIFIGGLPGDAWASCDGHGTLEAIEVINELESAGILCCLVGVSALIYYGAGRRRVDWEVCVPTDLHDRANALFRTEFKSGIYDPFPPGHVQMESLHHTFPRFKLRGVGFWFLLIPSEDCHFECKPSNLERSKSGLPYPKLDVFAQSLLDMDDRVNLTDLVDGMDLSEEWALQNLDLDGTIDVDWAERKNVKIRSSVPLTETSCILELSAAPFSRREILMDILKKKSNRIGPEISKEYFVTRFRPRGSADPRSEGTHMK